MSLVDERGRLFGAINLIDLGLLLFIAVLVPISYGAYVLFRTPPPHLIAVTPNALVAPKGVEQRVQVKGEHLPAFLRARLGDLDTSAFLISTPQSAVLRFSDVPPGTYDLVLFDESQEVARLPKAVTILLPPLQIVGGFVGSAARSDLLVAGLKFGPADQPVAELLDVEQAQASDTNTRHAVLRAACQLSPDNRCVIGGTLAQAGAELNLTLPGGTDRLAFRVKGLRADARWLSVTVRLMGLPESLAQVHLGDIDRHPNADGKPGESPIAGVTTGAIVGSLGQVLQNQGSFTVTATQPQPGLPDLSAYGILSAALPVDARTAQLTVPVESSPQGLRYHGSQIRPGNILPFETATYRLQALIMSVSETDRP